MIKDGQKDLITDRGGGGGGGPTENFLVFAYSFKGHPVLVKEVLRCGHAHSLQQKLN